MRLEWRPLALEDRAAIMNHIGRDNPTAALALDDAFEAHAEQARQQPTLYKPGRVLGTREIVVRPSYVMVYRHDPQAAVVTVLRVLHTARRCPHEGA